MRQPRIWIDTAHLATLQAQRTANTPDWGAFKALADGYKGRTVDPYPTTVSAQNIAWSYGYRGSYQGSSWLEGAFYLSLAYQLTGDAAYADTAIAILRVINASWDGRADASTYARGTIPISVNTGWTSRTYQIAAALIYDWCYDRLTPEDRLATASMTHAMYQWAAVGANDWPDRGGPPGANYTGGHLMGFGLSAIAMDGDDPRMTTLQLITRRWWDGADNANSIAASFAPGGIYSGGYNGEGYGNYGYGHLERLLMYALALKTHTGSPSVWADYPKRMFLAELHNLMPGRWRITGEGDWIGPGVGLVPASNFALYAHLLKGTQEGEYAQHVWNNLPPAPNGVSRKGSGGLWDDPFFVVDRTAKATDPNGALPPYHASPTMSDGHVYVRTDWTDAATWASYVGGTRMGGGHQISLAGNISIARGVDYLLPMIANWAGLDQWTGGPSIYDSPKASAYRGNTLYFYDYPIKTPTGWTPNYLSVSSSAFGGQSAHGTFAPWIGVPDLMKVKQAPEFTYALSQLAGAYDQQPGKISAVNRTLRSFHRTFVWIGDGYFVVKDRAISKAARAGVATYEKLFFWHLTPNTTPAWTDPTVTGSRLTTATVGTSKLVIDTLLPEFPVLKVRKTDALPKNGGPLSSAMGERHDEALFAETPQVPLTYRLEVRDPSPADTFQALTVLSAIGSDATAAEVFMISTISPSHVGVFIADATARVVVLPVDDEALVSSVEFTQEFTGAGRILIAGLAPGEYGVTKDGVQGPSITVGTDGVLYSEADGGGVFSIGAFLAPTPGPSQTFTATVDPSGPVADDGSFDVTMHVKVD